MNTASREAAMLDADRPTVGGWHLLHLILAFTSMGMWIIVWIIHAVVVSSMNSTIDKKIRIVNLYAESREEAPTSVVAESKGINTWVAVILFVFIGIPMIQVAYVAITMEPSL